MLVTGMSGSGKSTVLAELKRRGHRVIDTDDPGWIVETHTVGGPEPVWDLEQIKALIDGHRTGWLFIAGCVANQGAAYDRLDAVVLLSAPVDVILDRVADRANPFGSTAEDARDRNDPAAFRPVLRAGADSEIVTTAPFSSRHGLERVARCQSSRPAVAARAPDLTRQSRGLRGSRASRGSARPPASDRFEAGCRASREVTSYTFWCSWRG